MMLNAANAIMARVAAGEEVWPYELFLSDPRGEGARGYFGPDEGDRLVDVLKRIATALNVDLDDQ
jgi:hypothetical protein